MIEFGNILKQLRTSKGLSQGQLAKRIHVTKSMISTYENSSRLPRYDVLTKIAVFFKVSVDFLLGFDKRRRLDVTGLSDEEIEILSLLIDRFKSK